MPVHELLTGLSAALASATALLVAARLFVRELATLRDPVTDGDETGPDTPLGVTKTL